MPVLGTFDPLALLPHFPRRFLPKDVDWDGPRYTESSERLLSLVPSSVLAHELTHAVHTLTTACGIREYFLAIEDLRLRWELLREAAHAQGGRLRLPVLASTASRRHVQHLAECEARLRAFRLVRDLHLGGRLVARPKSLGTLAWVDPPEEIVSPDVVWNVSFFNGERYDSRPTVFNTGLLHLTEGVAGVVDRIQAASGDEPNADAVWLGAPADWPTPINPYHASYLTMLYLWRNVSRDSRESPSYAHLIALSDLALMIDPMVTPRGFQRFWKAKPRPAEVALGGYSPFEAFVGLCLTLWSNERGLPSTVDESFSADSMLALQEAVLQQWGTDLCVADLIDETAERVDALIDRAGLQLLVPDDSGLADAVSETFRRALRLRQHELAGTGFWGNLTGPREALIWLMANLVPAFGVGGILGSTLDLAPGHGIGVAQEALQAFRDVLDWAVDGHHKCFFAGPDHDSRICPLKPVALCDAIPPKMAGRFYCIREATVRSILASLGATSIAWIGSPP